MVPPTPTHREHLDVLVSVHLHEAELLGSNGNADAYVCVCLSKRVPALTANAAPTGMCQPPRLNVQPRKRRHMRRGGTYKSWGACPDMN